MNIKFIPKKQREELKENKLKQEQSQLIHQIQENQNLKEGKLKHSDILQTKANHRNLIQQEKINKSLKLQKITQQQQHQLLNEEALMQQPRQRSRDIKHLNNLAKQQLQERDYLKKKYLGLIKQQKSKRNSQSYKNNFLFEWENTDDTFQSGGYLGSTALRANQKMGKKYEDQIKNEIHDHWKSKKFEEMTERDWRIFREDNQIYIKGGRVPTPIRDWKQAPEINPILLQNFKRLNYEKPRPIQMQAITIGFQMRDLIAIAPTGEGKTLAYLIPIINFMMPLQRITGINSEKGPYAIILAPSRQLAEQIQAQFIKISQGLNFSSIRLVGGKQIQIQSLNLWKGADIIIGTPGRIKEMIEKHHLSLERLSWVVIDQADKMISENLSDEVQYILENSSSQSMLPEYLQRSKIIHMFSATMVPEIEKLVKTFLSPNPSYITIGQPGGGKKQIQQFVELIDQQTKNDRLGKILKNLLGPIIIFVNERDRCQNLVRRISDRWNRSVADYHGGKTQQTREKVINLFKTGKIQILVATDLAGRGLDVKGINAVINYDAPKNISEFIHRAGRTGRAGMKGKCFTFLTGSDENTFYDIRAFLERNQFKIPQNLRNHPAALVKPGGVAKIPKKKQIVYTN